MSLTPYFQQRDFSAQLPLEGIKWQVNSMRWSAIGGCVEASVTAFGPVEALWEIIEMLRCPVKIKDEMARDIWWGYVDEVQVRVGALEIGATLASMNNAVAVAYSFVQPGTQTVGQRKTTAWATNAESITEYGRKEFLSSQGGLSTAAAEAKRAAILASRKWPQGITNPFGLPRSRVKYSGAEESQSATILLKGWYNTLSWRYASWASVVGVSYQTTSATEQAVGSSSSNTKVMQQAKVGTQAVNLLSVSVYARKQGSPVDNFTVGVYALDGSGNPTGSALGSVTLAGGSMTGSLAWYKLTLSTEAALAAGVTYGIQVSRSGAADGTNYYVVNVNTGLGYANGVFKINTSGSTWAARSPDADMPFILWVNNNVESTTQIHDLAVGYGVFLTGVVIDAGSGVILPSYRDGDTLVLDEIKELLECGGINGRRLLACVDAQRVLRIWEEPASTVADYRLNRYGELLDKLLTPVDEVTPPVGVWVRLWDVIPGNVDVSKLNTPELQFIESVSWSEGNGVQLQFRGQPSIEEMFKIKR
jgi:hypothetical protein